MTLIFPTYSSGDAPPLRGYIEGYYGRLPSWDDRSALLRHLNRLGMRAYLYAPKEDPCHRFNWRQDYDDEWRSAFEAFCREADNLSVGVIAGIAPGADIDFTHKAGEGDWQILRDKCLMMAEKGASAIALLLDDIQPDRPMPDGLHEGEAHAALANALHDELAEHGIPLILTPRIYADEVMDHDLMAGGADDERYWPDLARELKAEIPLLVCGRYVIAPDTRLEDTAMTAAGIRAERAIIWDNLYAHDYCPRRLYLGPYKGRHESQHILLNPTGMIETDKLLLSIMAAGDDHDAWKAALAAHHVPDAFFKIAPFFDRPPHPDHDDTHPSLDDTDGMLAALDILLWQWKDGLAREWYPYLMGLRQDILLATGQMDALRQRKSLPDPLRGQLKKDEAE